MAKVPAAENGLCGLVVFFLAVGFVGSIIMVVILSIWQMPPTEPWMITNPGQVYYGVEVTFDDMSTVWQDDLYQTTSSQFQQWSSTYCNQMAMIMGQYIGRQYGGCDVISFRPGTDGTDVVVQFRITLLQTVSTSNVGCAASSISTAVAWGHDIPNVYHYLNATKVFNMPLPPTVLNTCQYTDFCRNSDICTVAQSQQNSIPVCLNLSSITLTCSS